ncbi:hypothetical protein [Alienimonas californiensis]|uniref:hypothetical protein n=1 Tax=Alienimonas californiensis TaxID=2527989 RepID=UPI00119F6D2C|nr:hypothetical protein [Alienimonas californiensis]
MSAGLRKEATAGALGAWLDGPAGLVELVAGAGAAGEGPAPWGFAVALAAAALRGADESDRDKVHERTAAVVLGGGGRGLPVAWAALGLRRAVWVRPRSDRDRLWALERCLRCPGLGATAGFLPAGLDPVAARRLALAAETGAAAGGGPGLLVRPAAARREACWADVRLEVAPAPGPGVRECDSPRPRWRVRVLRRRGAALTEDLERGVTLELTDDARLVPAEVPAPADSLPVAAGLAGAAGPPRFGERSTIRPRRREFARAG